MRRFDAEFNNLAAARGPLEINLAHLLRDNRRGLQLAAGIDASLLIDPGEQPPTEQRVVWIQIFRLDLLSGAKLRTALQRFVRALHFACPRRISRDGSKSNR